MRPDVKLYTNTAEAQPQEGVICMSPLDGLFTASFTVEFGIESHSSEPRHLWPQTEAHTLNASNLIVVPIHPFLRLFKMSKIFEMC